ncbi:unnamed protein product [Brassicogethes aeneus]|uniref:Uncharacterized protein n=1 Tax=Brassicogethes aeneus TaxID=1431903 RepID=A0A9P0APJ4_BRAAE|nr:unnamed protein product [Brassicogethes aeneus]
MMERPNQPYVSCIKINGLPILPPLISSNRKKELLAYKELAIQVENKLKSKKSSKETSERSVSTTNEEETVKYVPYKNLKSRTRHLSLDIVDVTEYNNQGYTVVKDASKETENFELESELSSPRPRLIRSNSYTIEDPSPCLLAHLEKQSETTSETSFLSAKNWASNECNYKPYKEEISELSMDVFGTPLSNLSGSTTIENITTDRSSTAENITIDKSPTVEVLQTDIIVQQITVHADPKSQIFNNVSPISKNIETTNNTLGSTSKTNINDDTESKLMQILKDIPEDYAKQILELIEKQKEEQIKRFECYENIKKQLLDETDVKCNKLTHTASTELRIKDSTPSKDNPVTLSCSTRRLNIDNNESIQLIDLEDDGNYGNTDKKSFREDLRIANISRELFPKINDQDVKDEKEKKEQWAANIICAHAKGYLTRRLYRTDKVQGLIDTIKDTLLCALQLHNAENIDEYDIELHRRLIQQVSAACYAFHDLFFSLSTREQMMIIAADRNYKLEKAMRSSFRSSRSSSSISSGRRPSVGKKTTKPPQRRFSGTKA